MKTLKKKREYELRIREVERASFTPIVLSSTGGMGSMATTTYKHLASLLTDKWGTSYSQTMGWLRCLSFSLIRSSIQCIRGARSNQGHAIHLPPSIELAVSESMIPLSTTALRKHSNFSVFYYMYVTYVMINPPKKLYIMSVVLGKAKMFMSFSTCTHPANYKQI